MSLQGSLETIPLPDVLALLAATKKTGELRIESGRGESRVWLDGGSVVGADVRGASTPVDAVFELLRLPSGTFAFNTGATAPDPGEHLAVEPLVEQAQRRLSEWRAIEAVVPSMTCIISLAGDLRGDSVTISKKQWKDFVAAASAGDVNGVMRRLGVGEFDACRTVKDLADAGLIKIEVAPPTPKAPAAPPARSEGGPSGSTPGAPESPEARGTSLDRRPPSAPAPAQAPPLPAPRLRPQPPPAAPAAPAAPKPAATPAKPAALAPKPGAAPQRPAPAAAAGRPSSAQGPSPEEADELVHQLATLAPRNGAAAAEPEATARPASTTGRAAAAKAPAPGPAAEETAQDADHDAPESAPTDEPLNRGMLLKFLSSVRP